MEEMLPGGLPVELACAAAACEMCHRDWRERCGRIGWRLAAGDLLFWSGPEWRSFYGRDAGIAGWLGRLRSPRGCALGIALAETVPGVTLAETVDFLVDLGFGPARPAELWGSTIGIALAGLGDEAAVRRRCDELMTSIHDATPRRPRG